MNYLIEVSVEITPVVDSATARRIAMDGGQAVLDKISDREDIASFVVKHVDTRTDYKFDAERDANLDSWKGMAAVGKVTITDAYDTPFDGSDFHIELSKALSAGLRGALYGRAANVPAADTVLIPISSKAKSAGVI